MEHSDLFSEPADVAEAVYDKKPGPVANPVFSDRDKPNSASW
ncbi:hypothetical protein [Mycolicibacterium sp. CH28]|jgi:hypothetical protein|nr:hypothetical protein [Mycolicibacterium sp. CH28]